MKVQPGDVVRFKTKDGEEMEGIVTGLDHSLRKNKDGTWSEIREDQCLFVLVNGGELLVHVSRVLS